MRCKKSVSKRILVLFLSGVLCLSLAGCKKAKEEPVKKEPVVEEPAAEIVEEPPEEPEQPESADDPAGEEAETEPAPEEETASDIYVIFTSDVHCGIDKGFGYAGLKEIRDSLEEQGYKTILADDGDSIQGENIGTVSKGETIIDLMNALHYDVAIPGNHEFDYGMDRFMELTGMAEFSYISCNFNKEGELVFEPFLIKEIGDVKIGFVGITTPLTITSSTPAYFQNESGDYIYGFMPGDDGFELYTAVQSAVDAARAEGAQVIYAMGHLGNEGESVPYTYADVIENTTGIDVFFDGHSHDSDKVVMKNKDGEDVERYAVGTKLSMIGYSHVSAEGEIVESGTWNWTNNISMPELLGLDNEVSRKVEEAKSKLEDTMNVVVAYTDYDLIVYDPTEKDNNGKPIRMIRRMETNLGDLCADAYRDQSGADIAFVNGGGIRADIKAGDITYGDIISVNPFGNELCMIKLSGQQILDALEWGSRALPGENGGFIQVSGLTYEIDVTVESGCVSDENDMFISVNGNRRVKNVMVGGEPIDPLKMYTVAGHNYMLTGHGDGYTMFDGAELLLDRVKIDNQVLIDYITGTLGGVIGEQYKEPYGEGRITILE